MSRISNSRVRLCAALGSLLLPAALVIAAGASHASHHERLGPAAAPTATFTPPPNCPTSAASDGNENTGFGDLGNENPGNCDVGNGNTTNNVDGNANGSNSDLPGENSKASASPAVVR